jgi:5-methylcytosine-specific restriction endonuclease McrA
VRERDDWRCRECGKSRDEGKLDVHHLVPAAEWDRPGSANEPDNLLTLCVGCHAKRHGLEVDERTRRARERSRRYYQAHRAERIAYAVEHQRDYRARRRATT